jgi:serine/threonine protein kinase
MDVAFICNLLIHLVRLFLRVTKLESWLCPAAVLAREGCLLGEGAYGKVYRHGCQAVKVVRCASWKDREVVRAEYDLMDAGSRGSCNIMGVDGLSFSWLWGTAEIRMPLARGSAVDYIAQYQLQQGRRCGLPEKQVVQLAQQALRGLSQLARMGVVHGDIKPHNILLTEFPKSGDADVREGTVKIADFGEAYVWGPSVEKTRPFGSPVFMAPEVQDLEKPKRSREFRDPQPNADVYSLGITMMALLLGHIPCTPADCDFWGETWAGISSETRDLVLLMLNLNPEHRHTADTLLASSKLNNHPALRKNSRSARTSCAGASAPASLMRMQQHRMRQ